MSTPDPYQSTQVPVVIEAPAKLVSTLLEYSMQSSGNERTTSAPYLPSHRWWRGGSGMLRSFPSLNGCHERANLHKF